jgi:hypothetical protein
LITTKGNKGDARIFTFLESVSIEVVNYGALKLGIKMVAPIRYEYKRTFFKQVLIV